MTFLFAVVYPLFSAVNFSDPIFSAVYSTIPSTSVWPAVVLSTFTLAPSIGFSPAVTLISKVSPTMISSGTLILSSLLAPPAVWISTAG